MRYWFLYFFSLPLSLLSYPTSLFWTTCTTDIVPTGMANLQVATYFTLFNNGGHPQILAPSTGFTVGVLDWHDWKAEAGFDYYGGLRNPWFFCAKVGIDEDKLFFDAPSFALGIFNMGTSDKTDFNIVNAVLGKTLPPILSGGRVFVGGYAGSHALRHNQTGYMVGYLKTFCPTRDCSGIDYSKWWLVADYASGRNFIGGGGVGASYFFNPRVCLITGPTWFNNAKINGKWKWTVQLNVLFSLFR